MKVNNEILILLFVVTQFTYGQDHVEKVLRGIVTVESVLTNGINVVNLNNNETSMTNSQGEFSILAKANDVLVLSGLNVEEKKIKVDRTYYDKAVFSIELIPLSTKLNEVIVQNNQFNLLSLGIVTKAPVKYTVAERRLQTAGDFKPIMLLQIIAGGMPLDPLINKINGRTKRLKKLIVFEKKEKDMKVISELFNDIHFNNILFISSENINGFKFYIVENENFIKILDSRNEPQISFYLTILAQEFKTIMDIKN